MGSHLPPPSSSGMAAGGRTATPNFSLPKVSSPFSLKVGQVFTGFGVGCGVGIGVGTPLNFGAIPILQQVMVATRGATDAFSGVGRHVNSSFRRLGLKRIEAGIGCGVGVGHGFGVGLAIKPGVLESIQSYIAQGISKVVGSIGNSSGEPANGTRSLQRNITNIVETQGKTLPHNTNYLTTATENTGMMLHDHVRSPSSNMDSHIEHFTLHRMSSEKYPDSRAEKVINSFLQNPLLKNKEEVEVDEVARQLKSENNVLQMVLKHQQIIEELIEENEKLRRALVEDLKVPADKLLVSGKTRSKQNNTCFDCLHCRRKQRTR